MNTYRDSHPITSRPPRIIVGAHSYYAGYYHGNTFDECVLYLDDADARKNVDRLIIGKYCSIASGAKFMMGGNQGHRHDWITTYPLELIEKDGDNPKNTPPAYLRKGDTIIGNDVWIGFEALIMPGITIGDGAVIAARSVVTRDVEPYSIVGGNPANLIRKRFSDTDIKTLLRIQWWHWPEEKIQQYLPQLRSGDIHALEKQPL